MHTTVETRFKWINRTKFRKSVHRRDSVALRSLELNLASPTLKRSGIALLRKHTSLGTSPKSESIKTYHKLFSDF